MRLIQRSRLPLDTDIFYQACQPSTVQSFCAVLHFRVCIQQQLLQIIRLSAGPAAASVMDTASVGYVLAL